MWSCSEAPPECQGVPAPYTRVVLYTCLNCKRLTDAEKPECERCGHVPTATKHDHISCPNCWKLGPAEARYCAQCGYDAKLAQVKFAFAELGLSVSIEDCQKIVQHAGSDGGKEKLQKLCDALVSAGKKETQ